MEQRTTAVTSNDTLNGNPVSIGTASGKCKDDNRNTSDGITVEVATGIVTVGS
jgi:hypothetical protein